MPRSTRHVGRRALVAPLAILWSALILATTVVPASAIGAPPQPMTESATEPTALTAGQLQVVRVAGGLNSPVGITHAGDGRGRLFVVERGGKVKVIKSRKFQSGVVPRCRLASRTGGRARAARARVPPELQDERLRLRLLPPRRDRPAATSSSRG